MPPSERALFIRRKIRPGLSPPPSLGTLSMKAPPDHYLLSSKTQRQSNGQSLFTERSIFNAAESGNVIPSPVRKAEPAFLKRRNRRRHSGSGFPLVSGRNGTAKRASR